jgi:acyl carrier protein
LATDRGAPMLDEASLLAFIRSELLDDRPVPIERDTYLFGDGMVDSLRILRLIAYVESQIGRQIPDAEVVMEHFRSVRAVIARFGGAP